ncbi:PASTA domain-containing protein [Christensenellaceae bacterium OttesenSCG-928-L17]|nr:PASTA domain-containing protein [Christensenellaceae bacterium OttesenSCG-928-L17]
MGAPDISNRKRLVIMLAIIGILFLLLLARLFYVQVIWGPELQEKALLQWTMDSSLAAERGRIVDRDGQTLAQSGIAYIVEVNPKQIKTGEVKRVATELANVLEMDFDYVLSRVTQDKQQIILKRQVSLEKVEELTSYELGRGVTFGIDTKRYYPLGNMLSQVLGFTTVDGIGQAGLELTYNKYLAGEAGRLITETDRDNMPLAYGSQEYIEPVNGSELELTVDSVVQSFLEKALEEAYTVNRAKNAQGIVMDVNTGEILAVSVKPDYDPNAPPRDDIETLQALMKCRVVTDANVPGTLFQAVTLAAAIDSGAATNASTFECAGYQVVNGERIKCWKSGGHSQQELTQAVQNACNPAFMTMALEMGKETLYEYLYKFGFGATTESGLTGESSGTVVHQKYVRDETVARIGIGESIAVTPIQLAAAAGAAINGGNLMRPYIIRRITGADGQVVEETKPTLVRRVISEQSSAAVRTLLTGVVEEGGGKNAQIPGYRIGGKTGTAQKEADTQASAGGIMASFIGFAPADNPQYLCLILLDEPQVSASFARSAAAPFVKDVLQETLMHYNVLPGAVTEAASIPDVVGMTAKEAAAALKDAGFTARYAEPEAEIAVSAQVPAANGMAIKGSDVLLYTPETSADTLEEAAQDTVTVPKVLGKTPFEAYTALAKSGLTLRMMPEEQSGEAVRQKPEEGSVVPYGSEVTVDFSTVS